MKHFIIHRTGALVSEYRKVIQCIFCILFHNAIGLIYANLTQSHKGCLECSIDAGVDFKRTVCLCAITQHTGDHHRLADIQTKMPVNVRNEAVGSTNTIITSMYQENGVMPSPKMAGLMAAAILSDTVMFKSPTCTKRDIAMAERLARIARVSIEDLGKLLFSVSGADSKTAEELFKTDYKQFHISEQNIGVSQITCADSSALVARSDEFLKMMTKLKKDKDFDIVLLMITDVLLEGSHIFYVGGDDDIKQAFSVEPKDNHFFLEGVMSRKKQIIPMLTALWG